MGLVKFITGTFINVFGITQPSAAEERRAAWFICVSLALIVCGLASAFLILFLHSHR